MAAAHVAVVHVAVVHGCVVGVVHYYFDVFLGACLLEDSWNDEVGSTDVSVWWTGLGWTGLELNDDNTPHHIDDTKSSSK